MTILIDLREVSPEDALKRIMDQAIKLNPGLEKIVQAGAK